MQWREVQAHHEHLGESFYGEIHSFHGKLAGGLSASLSGLVGTFITRCVAMEERKLQQSTKKKSWLMDTILRHQLSINSMDASGMDVLAWDLTMTSTRRL